MTGPFPGVASGAAIPRDWQSALLLPVPAAEPAVREHRARLAPSARAGVPASVMVLYPFLSPALIGDAVLASLTKLFAGFSAFTFTLDRVGWFGDSTVWLGPREQGPFRALTALAFAAFPACPPYGGMYPELIPHLTIGHEVSVADLQAAADAVIPLLPIEATAAEVALMAGPAMGLSNEPVKRSIHWRRLATFPLGPPSQARRVIG